MEIERVENKESVINKIMNQKTIPMFNKYPAYKDSGVEWLGEIPEHWEVTRLGSRFEERKTKVSDKVFAPLSVTKQGVLPQLDSAAKSNDGDNRKLVIKGDFVINSRSDRKGSSGIANKDGSVSLVNIVMKTISFNSSFCNYLFRSNAFVEENYRIGRGIVADLWTTRYDEMKNIKIGIPSPREQTAIATFLDNKTAKIDHAIAQKEKMIALLKERKQIIIQDLVTGKKVWNDALNTWTEPEEVKDSGVEWIGGIPAHWEVLPGLRFFKENKRSNNGMKESTVLSLSYGKIIIKRKEKLIGLVPESFETYQIVIPGDIVVRSTDLQNDQTSLRTGLAKDKGIITSAYINLGVLGDNHPEYLHAYLHFIDITKVLYKFGSGLRQNLGFSDFKRMPILYVPIEEQTVIVSHIETQSAKIDKAITLQEQQIAKLKELKSTLIDSAVMGKIKV